MNPSTTTLAPITSSYIRRAHSQTLTLAEGQAIQDKQVKHYRESLVARYGEDAAKKFDELVAAENAKKPHPVSGWEITRGAGIERLYFLAQGKTEEDHGKYLATMD